MSDTGPRAPFSSLNLNVRGMGHSATVAINERCDQLRREGRTVHKLGLGQSPFPVPERVVEALRRHAHEKDYLPVAGLLELREAVAAYTHRTAGVARGANDVLVGPGSKELMFLLQLVHYGDLVIPTPAWVSYAPQARILGRTVRFMTTRPEDEWMLTAASLEALCVEDPERPRVLILNYPSNPTGATFSPSQLEELATVARRHRVVLLSDEIYGELHHEGHHVSIASYYPEGTIVSSGLSKWCGAGGWRLGTFVFPPELAWLREGMAAAASETYTSTSAPIQYAAVTAFDGGEDLMDYLARSRRVLRALGGWAHGRLATADIHGPVPTGGFYLLLDFEAHRDALRGRGIVDGVGLCEGLLEEAGVAILPGAHFGCPADALTARLAYVDFDGAAAIADAGEGSTLDGAWLRGHCGRVVDAVEGICAFTARRAR